MAVGLKYRYLSNIRPVGTEIVVYDYITIPGVAGPGTYTYRLTELPLNVPLPNPQSSAIECREVDALNVEYAGPVRLTAIDQNGVLTAGKFIIKSGTTDADDSFRYGQITFSQFDAGRRFKVMYTGRGSLVFAEDILNLASGEALLANVIRPGHISADPADNFSFPGDLDVAGNLNIAGVINRSISEIAEVTDDILLMNANAVAPGPDVSFRVHRGVSGDPDLKWNETDDCWELIGTSSNTLVQAFDVGSPRFKVIGDLLVTGSISGSLTMLASYTNAQEAALVVPTNIPAVFYNSDDMQVKAVVSDGVGGAKLAVLG